MPVTVKLRPLPEPDQPWFDPDGRPTQAYFDYQKSLERVVRAILEELS